MADDSVFGRGSLSAGASEGPVESARDITPRVRCNLLAGMTTEVSSPGMLGLLASNALVKAVTRSRRAGR